MAISKRRESIPTEQFSAAFEELSKKIPAEDESDRWRSDCVQRRQETHSEIEVKDKPDDAEYSDSDSNTNVCIIHPLNFHKKKSCV
ncbi:hypothetical protein AVEN_190842-1 [Araneus ventricosus]|uniref:Uncharacterized protein n=1 Tax=Araneus ventricosus TaxID=182803 RepID=A0A4Y2E2W0_ARAVE|nr:hypothetical protein AVEN_190842-1 [Araneus ventricosus]